MGVAYNPQTVTDGLILHLDAGNYHKSYPTEKQLITFGSDLVTINSSSPTSGGVQYASIHATGWNLTNGQIPRYSYVALTYTISSNTALNSSGQAITTGTLQGTQFGPGDIIDNSLPGVPLSQGTHTLYFSADGEVYAPNSAERRVLYVAVSSAISSGSIVISSAKLLYANKIYDMSGGGSNGTLTNGPTYNSSNGGSLTFDGSNDYVNCGNNSILNNTSNYYSISAWFKTTYTGNWQWICQFGEHAVNKDRSLVVRSDGFATNYTYGNDVIGTTNVRTGDWFFAVATTTPTTKKIYVNGTLENQGSWTPASYNFTNCTIGVLNDFVSYPFNGNIAQVSIYNRALTASEIQQNFNATRGRYGI